VNKLLSLGIMDKELLMVENDDAEEEEEEDMSIDIKKNEKTGESIISMAVIPKKPICIYYESVIGKAETCLWPLFNTAHWNALRTYTEYTSNMNCRVSNHRHLLLLNMTCIGHENLADTLTVKFQRLRSTRCTPIYLLCITDEMDLSALAAVNIEVAKCFAELNKNLDFHPSVHIYYYSTQAQNNNSLLILEKLLAATLPE